MQLPRHDRANEPLVVDRDGSTTNRHHDASTAEEPDSPNTSALFGWDDGESDHWTVTSEMS